MTTPSRQFDLNQARRVAYDWSAGSGSGLFLYSFASLGCQIWQDEQGTYKPDILAEIDRSIQWLKRHPDWESVDKLSDLEALRKYVEAIDVSPPGRILRAMADHFLLLAWADHCERIGHIPPGREFRIGTMGDPPAGLRNEAEGKAVELYQRIADKWAKQIGRPISIPEAIAASAKLERVDFLRHLIDWSSDAVSSAVGIGAYWEDSHSPLLIDAQEVEVRTCIEGIEWYESEEEYATDE